MPTTRNAPLKDAPVFIASSIRAITRSAAPPIRQTKDPIFLPVEKSLIHLPPSHKLWFNKGQEHGAPALYVSLIL